MSTDLQASFEQAAKDAQSLPSRPNNDTLLRLYALYKQGSTGDATGKRPGMLDPVGRAKFDAWSGVKGMSKDEAKQAYVTLVNSLKG